MVDARREGRPGSLTRRVLGLGSAAGIVAAAPAALAADAHGGGHGLVLFPEWTELVPLMVLFVLLIPLVDRLLFRPIFQILDAREERIDGARRRSAQLDQDAAAVLERYRVAVNQARAEADTERKATLDAARRAQAERIARERAEAERRREEARTAIDGALGSAREALRRDVETLARDAAARILGRTLS